MKITSREQLLNIADRYDVARYDDGRINKIDAFLKNRLIHTTQAVYTTNNGLTRLTDIQGFLFPEVWNSLETPELNWFDRNPLNIANGYVAGLAPHANTTRWTYTVPQNRKCYLEFLDCQVTRQAAAGPVGNVDASVVYFAAIAPATPVNIATSDLFTNGVGDNSKSALGQSLLLYAGDVLYAQTSDLGTGGQCFYNLSMKGTEFDA